MNGRAVGLLSAGLFLGACRGRDAASSSPAPTASPPPAPAVPVRVASPRRGDLVQLVTAPGRTSVLWQDKIRAPFTGTLTELLVTDGDAVRQGQRLGTIVSRDSEAALTGAREMARQAKTDAERRDAARAVSLAERGLVRAPLLSSADGVVLSHAAAAGERLSEGQEILSVADSSSIVFVADTPQSELARIRPGQPAEIDLAGRPAPVAGVVHDVLPGANAADFTVPVRVDMRGVSRTPPLGLFGHARITVAERHGVLLIPEEAVIRDDVHGTTRIALVGDHRAHWVDVTPGGETAGSVEIVSPALSPTDRVIVSGQVGLPEGAAVIVE